MRHLIWALLFACCDLCTRSGAEDSLMFMSRTKLSGYSWGVSSNKGNIKYIPNRGSISIVDVSNPNDPIHIKNHDPNGGSMGVFVVDTILYSFDSGSFSIINIADSINPVNLYWKWIGGTSEDPHGIFVSNNICYITRASSGINIFDVSNPALPESVGFYNTPTSARSIFVEDTIAYIADYDSLQIVKVTNPSTPIRISSEELHWGFTGITKRENHTYCATRGDWGTDGRVVAVDVSDPANPVKCDSVYSIMGNPITTYYANNRIYSIAADYFAKKGRGEALPIGCKEKADVEGGGRVLNVAKPDSIFYTCGFNTFSDPRDAIADSQYVYIADQDSGLIILRHNHYTGVGGKPNVVKLSGKMRLSLSPNPAKGSFTIQYTVPEPGNVTINIYNMTGQLVRTLVDGHKRAGKHTIVWNGKADNGQSVSSGNYLCRYNLNGKHTTQKAIVVR